MSDKKLESFKIGDVKPAAGSAPPAPVSPKQGQTAENEPSMSLGFSRIEKILDKEDPVQIGQSLNTLLASLEAFGAAASSQREKHQAEKASVAVERAVDLMDYLFQTKEALQSGET